MNPNDSSTRRGNRGSFGFPMALFGTFTCNLIFCDLPSQPFLKAQKAAIENLRTFPRGEKMYFEPIEIKFNRL